MLSIWKLVRSSSTSGPSWTVKPNRPKISAISAIVSMTGWSAPRATGRPGVVTSTASLTQAIGELAPAQGAAAFGQGRLDRRPDLVGDRPDARPVLGRQAADPAQDHGQRALLAEDLELEGSERGAVRGADDRRQRTVAQARGARR